MNIVKSDSSIPPKLSIIVKAMQEILHANDLSHALQCSKIVFVCICIHDRSQRLHSTSGIVYRRLYSRVKIMPRQPFLDRILKVCLKHCVFTAD